MAKGGEERALKMEKKEEEEWGKGNVNGGETRSQAVARIADRTAKNCRGHVT